LPFAFEIKYRFQNGDDIKTLKKKIYNHYTKRRDKA
jgi:hypothetical protein